MKSAFVGLLLALPLAAHASIDSSGRAADPVPAGAVRQPEAAPSATAGRGQDATPRRTRMSEATAEDAPVMRFSAMYRVVGVEQSTKDNCLKGTGTRLKRESDGSGACAMGNGRVFVPER